MLQWEKYAPMAKGETSIVEKKWYMWALCCPASGNRIGGWDRTTQIIRMGSHISLANWWILELLADYLENNPEVINQISVANIQNVEAWTQTLEIVISHIKVRGAIRIKISCLLHLRGMIINQIIQTLAQTTHKRIGRVEGLAHVVAQWKCF
jgi:hypothetical protein